MNSLFQGFLNAIKAKIVPLWTKIRLLTNPTYLKNEVLRKLIIYFRQMTDILRALFLGVNAVFN